MSYWNGYDAPTEPSSDNQPTNDAGNVTDNPDTASDEIEKVIAEGMKHLGTPYEYASNRSTAKTFDCSDFVRWVFNEAITVKLPADSRQQGAFVKENHPSSVQTDWHQLKRGDLMFFMSYEGSDEASYKSVDKSSQRITHVGIYLGNGTILHTYSKASGGVTTSTIEGTQWEHRFLFGGSAI